MKHRLAVFLMKRAACWSRHAWLGEAMLADFNDAHDDGHGLRFAAGCVWASLKTTIDARRALSLWPRAVVALILFAPFAVFEFGCTWQAVRFIATGSDHYYALLMKGSEAQQLTAQAYRDAAPLITFLLMAMAVFQSALAWSVLRGQFASVRAVMRCIGVAGLMMAVIALAVGTDTDFAALAIYIGLPLLQWCLVRWMDNPVAH